MASNSCHRNTCDVRSVGLSSGARHSPTRKAISHRKCRPLKPATVALLLVLSSVSSDICSTIAAASHNNSMPTKTSAAANQRVVAAIRRAPQVRNLVSETELLQQQHHLSVANATGKIETTQQHVEDDMMKLPLYMRTFATLACLVIFSVGVCGNLLVPLVVIKTKYLRNSTNLFLINLSVADLLVLIVCMPIVLIELHSRPETWLLGEPMCKLSNFIEMLAANGSIFTILAISFERYYAICKPLKAGYKCTRLRATIIICLIWLLACILTSPILIIAKSSETIYIDGSLVYNCILETDTYWHKMYVFVSMFAFFCLPLLVLMLVYWLIGRRLIRENLAMSSTSQLVSSSCTQSPPARPDSQTMATNGHWIGSASLRPRDYRANACRLKLKKGISLKSTLAAWFGAQKKQINDGESSGANHYQHLLVGTNCATGNNETAQIRRPKPGKAYSLDNHHLFTQTLGAAVTARAECSLEDGIGGQQTSEEHSTENSDGNKSIINLHKFICRLFWRKPCPTQVASTLLQKGQVLQEITSTQVKDCDDNLGAILKRDLNGLRMQAINEQPALANRSVRNLEPVVDGSELNNDEHGNQTPFLPSRSGGNDHQAAYGCSNDSRSRADGRIKQQLSLGSSLNDGATSVAPAPSVAARRRAGLLRRSTMNRQQLAKDPSSCFPVGSKFTRWAARFSMSSSSVSMLTTTTSAALTSEVDCISTGDQRDDCENEYRDACSKNYDLKFREERPQMQKTVARRYPSNDYASSDCRKSDLPMRDNKIVIDEKQRGDSQKCTRFGSVSTTNCSSPIPSSSDSSAASPYSSASKTPSPDSIFARRQHKLKTHEAKYVDTLGVAVKAPKKFALAELGPEQKLGTLSEKLSKVYETPNNCDSEIATSNQVPNGDGRALAQQHDDECHKSASKSFVGNNRDHNDTNQQSGVDENDAITPRKKLRQIRDEHKSLDIASIHHQNNHSHHSHYHFHFNLKRSNRRSGSQPVVCSHLGSQNGTNTKLNELLVVQDLSKKQQMDSRRQVVIMLAFVVACFFLLFFPYRVFTIWLILSTEAQVQSLGMETYYNLTYFSRILIYLHSAINPIAYNLISTKFRRAFMSILLCRGSSTRRHFTTEHRIINRRMTFDDHQKSIRQATSHQTR